LACSQTVRTGCDISSSILIDPLKRSSPGVMLRSAEYRTGRTLVGRRNFGASSCAAQGAQAHKHTRTTALANRFTMSS
jgi:hypothetical protein